MANESLANVIETDNITRVYNLVVELADTERRKKAAAKDFAEEIRRIKAEIKDLIEEREGTEQETET